MRLLLALALSYLVGAVPWSWLAARATGVDLRRYGSGNLGATNTFRAVGARLAVPVLVLDVLKGVVAVVGFATLAYGTGGLPDATIATLCGIAAIVGHMFPIYLGFRGGKGIATSAGVFAALEPLAFVICFVVFGVAFGVSGGIVSLGSLLSSLALPVALYAVGVWRDTLDWNRVALAAVLVVVVWSRHTSNISRLLQRTEKSVFESRRRAG